MNNFNRVAIGLVVAGVLIGGASLLGAKPSDDVVFLERMASRIERVKTVAPETRDYFTELMGRYEPPLTDARLDARKQKALMRMKSALRPANAPETTASGREDDAPVLVRTIAPMQ